MAEAPIKLTAESDLAFARIAQGALVQATTLPSGMVTPDRPLIVQGDELVEPTESQLSSFSTYRRPY